MAEREGDRKEGRWADARDEMEEKMREEIKWTVSGGEEEVKNRKEGGIKQNRK